MAFLEQEKRIFADFAENERLPFGKPMVFRQSSKQGLAKEFLGDEFFAANRQRQNDYINMAVVDPIEQDRRDLFHYADRYGGITPGEAGQRRAEKIGRDRGNRADDNGSHFGLRHLLNLGACLADLAQNLACLGEKCLAEIREPGETRKAVEELGAEFVFKLANLL